MKTCFKCHQCKPKDEFYRHPKMADGYLGKCKTCTKRDAYEHRHGDGREAVLARDRQRPNAEQRKRASLAGLKRRRSEHPEKTLAQDRLRRAIKSGRVVPWPVCAVPECNDKPEGHHYDYSQPLSVIWLCSAHHKQTHAIAYYANKDESNHG